MAVNCPTICGQCMSGNWWRQYSRHIFVIVYLIIACTGLALTIWETVLTSRDEHGDPTVFVWFVAGVSVQIAVAISLWNMLNHMIYYTRPSLQKYTVRMIGIVPAHSVNCWLSLKYSGSAIYLDTIRNFYQAVVIFSFMSLLLTYLHETFSDLEQILVSKPTIKSTPPCCCVKAVPNKRLIGRCRAGVLNYTIIHPLITVLAIITEFTGHYTEGSFYGLWIWFTIIDAISQIWAMYCLRVFYQATKEELVGLRPMGKLITVQLTIFGSFFQSFLINVIIGLSNPSLESDYWGPDDDPQAKKYKFIRTVQDFILCIEMSLSAVGHLYAFPYTEYKQGSAPQNCCKSCIACCSVTDIVQDVAIHVKRISSKNPALKDQIVYDDEQPVVELDEMAIVRADESDTDDPRPPTHKEDPHPPTQHSVDTDVHDETMNKNMTHEKVDADIEDRGEPIPRSVRHDSGSYSAQGEIIGHHSGSDDGMTSSLSTTTTGTTMNREEEEETTVAARAQPGLDMLGSNDDSGDVDLSLQAQARTIASIDGLPLNMEFDA